MAEVKFHLRDPKSEGETLIYLIYRIKNKRLKYSTGESINPCFWDKENQRAITDIRKNPKQKKINKDINHLLENYKQKVEEVISNWKYQKITATIEGLKEELDAEYRKQRETAAKLDLNSFIEKLINDMESGNRTTERGERYKPSTVKNFRGFQSQFNNFQSDTHRMLNFKDINLDFYDRFVKYFNDKDYSPNTIGRYIKNLKIVMKIAREEFGLHDNYETERRKFKVFNVKTTKVYLTESELKKIRKQKFKEEPNLKLARDVFLVGCYTALRYSDYSRINETHIKTTESGTKVIDIKTQKTGERVIIPIRPELNEILARYDYNLPKTYEQKINSRIKQVCKKAGIIEKIRVSTIQGGLKVEKLVPKYKLVVTHTARRTGATNMYLAGIPSIDIMKITGHRTEANFLKYIWVSKEETADKLAHQGFFKGSNLRVAKGS